MARKARECGSVFPLETPAWSNRWLDHCAKTAVIPCQMRHGVYLGNTTGTVLWPLKALIVMMRKSFALLTGKSEP